jgi:hypothetical protein
MIRFKKFLLPFLFAAFLISCSSAQNNKKEQGIDTDLKEQVSKEIESQNELKSKAFETSKLIHKLLNERQFQEVYRIIDNNSSLKTPQSHFLKDTQEFVDKVGKLEKMELHEDQQTVNYDLYQVKQEFTVRFENDPPAIQRNETFVWKIYPDNDLKLLNYSNEIEK